MRNGARTCSPAFRPCRARSCSIELDVRRYRGDQAFLDLELDPGYISVAEPVEFPTDNGVTAHAFFYPPRNKDFRRLRGELPPLLVMSHGGPTAAHRRYVLAAHPVLDRRGASPCST